MAQMIEEEAKALDEYYTKNPPKVDPSKRGGRFTRQRDLLEAPKCLILKCYRKAWMPQIENVTQSYSCFCVLMRFVWASR
jgi:hypothetical protein